MIRLSLDTETLGISAGSKILQIACVDIDNPSDCIDLKLKVIDQDYYGFTCDESTLAWGQTQTKAVRDQVFSGTLPIDYALESFAIWFKDITGKDTNVEVWMNSPSFDSEKILAPAFAKLSLALPWTYYQERDFRTMSALGKKYFNFPYKKPSGAHNALTDAKAQGAYLYELEQRILNAIHCP